MEEHRSRICATSMAVGGLRPGGWANLPVRTVISAMKQARDKDHRRRLHPKRDKHVIDAKG